MVVVTRFFLFCAVGLSLTLLGSAASFDCNKAKTLVEQTICSNTELSSLDDQVATRYKEALQTTENKESVKTDQRKWLTTRNNCKDVECLKKIYINRISELDKHTTSSGEDKEALATSRTRSQHPMPPPSISNEMSKPSVVSVSDPTFQSCKSQREPALEPILANRNLCILVYKQNSSLKGHVDVYLIGPSTIDERNRWINEVGKWLKTQGIDACAQETMYMTDPDSVKPPLAKQVAGIPGEKAFYMLGGLDSPTFCPQPCRWGSLDRFGQCSKGLPQPAR